jgi:hypothetical protein
MRRSIRRSPRRQRTSSGAIALSCRRNKLGIGRGVKRVSPEQPLCLPQIPAKSSRTEAPQLRRAAVAVLEVPGDDEAVLVFAPRRIAGLLPDLPRRLRPYALA